tara:strand:- start:436 stop:699 length:264 start_codon:yes stop_codon:yes gene_type:complete
MSDDLTKEQRKELEELQKEMVKEAKKVREDYKKKPSKEEEKASVSVDFDSPYLDEAFKDDSWKKVVKPEYIEKFNSWLKEEKKKEKK